MKNKGHCQPYLRVRREVTLGYLQRIERLRQTPLSQRHMCRKNQDIEAASTSHEARQGIRGFVKVPALDGLVGAGKRHRFRGSRVELTRLRRCRWIGPFRRRVGPNLRFVCHPCQPCGGAYFWTPCSRRRDPESLDLRVTVSSCATPAEQGETWRISSRLGPSGTGRRVTLLYIVNQSPSSATTNPPGPARLLSRPHHCIE